MANIGRRALGALGPEMEVQSRGLIRSNGFCVVRGLEDYEATFGDGFRGALKALGPDDHVLDAGAGELGAMREYLGARGARAAVTAVSFQAADENVRALEAHSRARALTGRYFEDISDEELIGDRGRFKLISDLYGVFSYAADPMRVLNRYLELLAPGGEIFLLCSNGFRVRHGDETELSLRTWLLLRPELKATLGAADETLGLQPSTPEARVPDLELGELRPFRKPPPGKLLLDPNRLAEGLAADVDVGFGPENRWLLLRWPANSKGQTVLVERMGTSSRSLSRRLQLREGWYAEWLLRADGSALGRQGPGPLPTSPVHRHRDSDVLIRADGLRLEIDGRPSFADFDGGTRLR